MTHCSTGKIGYATAAAAWAAIGHATKHKRLRKAETVSMGKLRAYRCGLCEQFHLGHATRVSSS